MLMLANSTVLNMIGYMKLSEGNESEDTSRVSQPRFKDMGRILRDDVWLNRFSFEIQKVCEGKKAEFHHRVTPSVVYVLGNEIKPAYKNLDKFRSLTTTYEVINMLVGEGVLVEDLAINGLSNIRMNNIKPTWIGSRDPSIKRFDVHARIVDKFEPIYGARLMQAETNRIKIALGRREDNIFDSNDGREFVSVMLGTVFCKIDDAETVYSGVKNLSGHLKGHVSLSPINELEAFANIGNR
jgi:hypothetical protein